ncbi:MAG: hypothetical protein KAT57_06595 [Candidatus Lokiarchaeota archaeon]|nr:hypothetical protein [Candidatus Lokiarchaeota archaeon]
MRQPNFSKDFACNHREHLPCQFGYRDGNVYRCSYDRLWVLAKWISNDEQTAAELLDKACPPIKDKEQLSQFLAKIHKEYANDVIKNADIGDIIFCFDETNGEVILLEKPKTDTGLCVYRTATGETRSKPVKLFRITSQGNYAAEYLIEGEKSEIESLMIKRMALEAGFRVEIQKTDSGHMVKIFGDTQQDVDDFMTMCVYNKFLIY